MVEWKKQKELIVHLDLYNNLRKYWLYNNINFKSNLILPIDKKNIKLYFFILMKIIINF
jgi:hypothetical protein